LLAPPLIAATTGASFNEVALAGRGAVKWDAATGKAFWASVVGPVPKVAAACGLPLICQAAVDETLPPAPEIGALPKFWPLLEDGTVGRGGIFTAGLKLLTDEGMNGLRESEQDSMSEFPKEKVVLPLALTTVNVEAEDDIADTVAVTDTLTEAPPTIKTCHYVQLTPHPLYQTIRLTIRKEIKQKHEL
jgi:hypothetical protein